MSRCHLLKHSSGVILWGHCRLSYFHPACCCCRHNGLTASNCPFLQLWLWIIRQDNEQSRPGAAGWRANKFVNDKVSRDTVLLIFLARRPKRISNPRPVSMNPYKTRKSDINKKSQFVTLFTSRTFQWRDTPLFLRCKLCCGVRKELKASEGLMCGAVNGLS